ncbi:TetR/AcrR family transcriptional regulator [Streptomyces hainanensis]|uniref:TetR/AcrR family transcriptional regulator n=1 Tax=Streptomyces hainanensis TaxID=402648 RepID=A0A4R4TG78_9ACTN|nr:TetR/AcrR family transcriptional regulator [Streptomyces hainanensis]TDC73953.1 TetR/AcrR family transcriptional regulator [Streptomyces hainanensis]
MPADHRGAPPPTRPSPLRERRRAVAVREILAAAERHITEHGPHALSLRAVARDLGMTVQALYHYFPSRDALVTSLIAKAYEELTDAVRAAVESPPEGDADLPGLVIAAEGYRRWALAHPERFQLLYGAPLRYYAAPVEGPTTQAVRRMSAIFERQLFGGFTPERLAAAEIPELPPSLLASPEQMRPDDPAALPPPAAALLLSAWGHLHGLVSLEVFGHTSFIGERQQAEVFRMAMRHLLDDVHRRIAGS